MCLDISREKWLNCLQTVEILIRRRVRRLIWICTVCQLPFWRSPDYNGLMPSRRVYFTLWVGHFHFQRFLICHVPFLTEVPAFNANSVDPDYTDRILRLQGLPYLATSFYLGGGSGNGMLGIRIDLKPHVLMSEPLNANSGTSCAYAGKESPVCGVIGI